MMGGPGRGRRRNNVPKNPNADIKKDLFLFFKSLKKYYPFIIIASLLTMVSVVVSIIAPQYLSKLTDEMANNGYTNSIDMDVIYHYVIILSIMYGVSILASFLSGFIMNDITQRYSKGLRSELTEKLNKLPLSYFDRNPYGDTLSIMTNDVDNISQSLQSSTSMLLQSIIMMIGVLIAMFITNWIMALTVIISLPLMVIMILFVTKLAVPQFRKRQKMTGVVNGICEENFTGALVIKIFNAEKKKQIKFDEANQVLKKTMFKAQIFGGLMQPISTFISYFAYAAVCLVGGLIMANDGGITFGTITAFLVYVNLFQSPLNQISQAMNSVQMAISSSSRIFEILFEDEEVADDDKETLLLKDGYKLKGEIDFNHVRFGYYPDKIIIPDFNCHVEPGSKVAIVGPTGAGKTTLVNLLMRFYELNSGSITIDGVSIADMKKTEVRDIFGMVLQDAWIFDGTLRENIVYSNTNATDEEINKALENASLTYYVSTLEKGLDTYIQSEESLSQGQRQLITIARASLANAPLLILDEATSNIDTRTEIIIQEAMNRLTEGRTSFVIAHRLSTIKNADLILVLNDGNIVEQGNHEELLKLNGFYASLYNSQFLGEEI